MDLGWRGFLSLFALWQAHVLGHVLVIGHLISLLFLFLLPLLLFVHLHLKLQLTSVLLDPSLLGICLARVLWLPYASSCAMVLEKVISWGSLC